jgi:hypothetical protein
MIKATRLMALIPLVMIPRGTETITRIGIEIGKSKNRGWGTEEVELIQRKVQVLFPNRLQPVTGLYIPQPGHAVTDVRQPP